MLIAIFVAAIFLIMALLITRLPEDRVEDGKIFPKKPKWMIIRAVSFIIIMTVAYFGIEFLFGVYANAEPISEKVEVLTIDKLEFDGVTLVFPESIVVRKTTYSFSEWLVKNPNITYEVVK